MRVKEPLNGFRKSQGHIIYHIALLAVNMYLLQCPEENHKIDVKEHDTAVMKEGEWVKNMNRCMHAFLLFTNLIRVFMNSKENSLLIKLIRVFEIFLFMFSILYQQFFVLLHPPSVKDSRYFSNIKFWMLIETVIFYGLIINAAIFLAFIQIRGILGYKSQELNKNRFKYDALDYYENDIEWLSFSLVPIFLHISVFYWTYKLHELQTWQELWMIILICLQKLVQIVLISNFRNQDKKIIEHASWKWCVLGSIQFTAAILFFMDTAKKTNGSIMVFQIDTLILILQYLYHYQVIREGKEGKKGSLRLLSALTGKVNRFDSMDEKTQTSEFSIRNHKVEQNIYSLAYAALINPDEMKNLTEAGANNMVPIELMDEERDQLFLSAMLVTCVQATTIYLINIYFRQIAETHNGYLVFNPAEKFEMLIPRLLSSIMMHIQVEPEIRKGINHMKYAINHPRKFRVIQKKEEGGEELTEEELDKGMQRRVFAAFLIGFCQASICMVAEVQVILYLCNLTDLLDIIRKFVSMAIVVRFDSMYAGAMAEHSIKRCVGKSIKVDFQRQMACKENYKPSNDQVNQINDQTMPILQIQDSEINESNHEQELCAHPTDSKPFLKFLRFIMKTYRFYFICWCYYFMPVTCMLASFYQNTQAAVNKK